MRLIFKSFTALIFLLLFTNDSMAQTLKGDINNDGKVDEADVSVLVDAYLNNASVTSATDLDEDAALTIADVTALIVLLNKGDENESYNGHDYVDLGLPSGTMWATCNMDSNAPEEYGGIYAWGEIETKEVYSWDTYKWSNGRPTKDNYTLTKYCPSDGYGNVDNKMTLDAADDVAHVKWGGSWHVPTDAEFQELLDNCSCVYMKQNGAKGFQINGPKGKSIFIPIGNYEYWSSSLRPNGHGTNANALEYADGALNISGLLRYEGLAIRPVFSQENYNGHECVDLGLPSGAMWATCNMDASTPEEYGGIYAWGETETKDVYSWDTYLWSNGRPTKDNYTLTKYCTSDGYGTFDNKLTLEPDDDVVHVKWGSYWHIPTDAEFQELLDNCSCVYMKQNGAKGFRITGPNGQSIFIPIGNYEYWSSSLRPNGHGTNANALEYADGALNISGLLRYEGHAIRPIYSK